MLDPVFQPLLELLMAPHRKRLAQEAELRRARAEEEVANKLVAGFRRWRNAVAAKRRHLEVSAGLRKPVGRPRKVTDIECEIALAGKQAQQSWGASLKTLNRIRKDAGQDPITRDALRIAVTAREKKRAASLLS